MCLSCQHQSNYPSPPSCLQYLRPPRKLFLLKTQGLLISTHTLSHPSHYYHGVLPGPRTSQLESVKAPRYNLRGRSPADHNARLCKFLTIAPEIRLRIYRHLFSSTELQLRRLDGPVFARASEIFSPGHEGNIILTSRQCVAEAQVLFCEMARVWAVNVSFFDTIAPSRLMKQHTQTICLPSEMYFVQIETEQLTKLKSIRLRGVNQISSLNPPEIDGCMKNKIQERRLELQEQYEDLIVTLRFSCPEVTVVVEAAVVVQRRHSTMTVRRPPVC